MTDKARRKELSRAYKETRRTMGVYRIRDRAGSVTLLGSSADLEARLNRHRAQLRMRMHPSRQLQAAWDAGGSDAVVLEVLDTLEPSDREGYDPSADLAELEQLWRDKLEREDE